MIESLFSMQGKVCLITGGSRGLGAFMAQGFLEAGAERVYITARKAAPCLEAAEALSQFGDCVALPGDISTTEGLIQLVAELNQRESISMYWSITQERLGRRLLVRSPKLVGIR